MALKIPELTDPTIKGAGRYARRFINLQIIGPKKVIRKEALTRRDAGSMASARCIFVNHKNHFPSFASAHWVGEGPRNSAFFEV